MAMNNKGRSRSNKKSLCEKSMKMVANIVKLSSFSIAKMSLGTASVKSPPSFTASVVKVENTPSQLSQLPRSRMVQEPQSSSFLMQPTEGNGSLHVIHEEENSVDGKASEYIKRVREKNRYGKNWYDSSEASTLSPYLLPPPPRGHVLM